MRTLRNVFRRKLRVLLTVFGITIGVLALVVMGSMAEKMNMLVSGGTKYYSDKVTVQPAGAALFANSPLSLGKRDAIKAVPGVAEVSAEVGMLLNPEQGASFGMPDMIIGRDMRGRDLESFKTSYSAGRGLTPDDSGSVVIGADMVKKLNTELGATVTLRGERFTVLGIMEKTLTAPDTSVYMTLADAQRLYMQDIPEVVRDQVNQRDLVTSFVVYPTPGTDPEKLASAINRAVEGVNATGPRAFQEQVASAMSIFNAILYGIAIIALFVGGLSVINTMTMSVNERTREIGVRKAIGASDGQIVRQFLAESAVIGLIGGVSGLFLGWLAATVGNGLLESRGLNLFLVSPRLAVGAVAFAVLLGLISGLYPSLHAARLQPVLALRYE
jgi:putative ABC transport system permease protein